MQEMSLLPKQALPSGTLQSSSWWHFSRDELSALRHYQPTITRRYEVLGGDIVTGSPPPTLATILTVLHITVLTRGMYPKTIGNSTLSWDEEITKRDYSSLVTIRTHQGICISPSYRCRKRPSFDSRDFPQEHCSPRLWHISAHLSLRIDLYRQMYHCTTSNPDMITWIPPLLQSSHSGIV